MEIQNFATLKRFRVQAVCSFVRRFLYHFRCITVSLLLKPIMGLSLNFRTKA